ncbi:MAG TPA: TolC family protein [Vicinamibacterales bacterium]
MTRNLMKWIATPAVLAAMVSTASAQQKITDEHVQELIRVAAQRAGAPAQPGATPARTQGDANHASLSITLDDAIKLALDRNLDIAVQRLNPQTFDFSYASVAAFYKPNLISTLSSASNVNPSTSRLTGGNGAGAAVNQGVGTFNGGLSQNLRWGGGSLTATLNNNRQTTTSLNTLFNPTFNTNWSAQYTQPLMRNFKIDTTRQTLVVTKLNQDISEIQLQALIINTVSNVRNAYWDYVFAVQSVEVAKQSVDLADQLVKDNQTRVEVGTMAPIDIVQAQSQAATQRQNLATAIGTQRTAELALKRLIVGGTEDPNWSVTLDPVDRPDFAPQPIDIPAAVKRGLENRTDLQQAKKNLQVNDVTLKYLRNQILPQADVTARYGLIGVGGSQLTDCSGTGINLTCASSIPGGYGDALSTLFHNNYPTWSVALNVSYPLGVSQAEANVARARIQQNQVDAQLKQIELQIATDVTNAATNVQSNVERVQAAQVARQFAQRTLEAEQSKFEVGMQTNYFVVQEQRDLATAQNNELQAILAYRKSVVELERLQQTSLSTSNITILGR